MGIIESMADGAGVERLWSHTVGISNRAIVTHGIDPATGSRGKEEEAPGTGSAGIWGKHHVVLTAKHVLAEAQPQNLSFFVRQVGELKTKRTSDITMQEGVRAVPLNDQDARIYRCESEDLAILTIKPDALGPNLEFFDIASTWVDPPEGDIVVGMGYPVSIAPRFARQVGTVVEQSVLLTPMAFSGTVLSSASGKYFGGFNPDRHYLIPYELGKHGKHPKGISGAAVWAKSDEKQIIWAPRLSFAGVCTSCYKDGTVEQVVKASVVRQFLTDVLGDPDQ
jgi:hypothetical protein